jgi:hypothetical protein
MGISLSDGRMDKKAERGQNQTKKVDLNRKKAEKPSLTSAILLLE